MDNNNQNQIPSPDDIFGTGNASNQGDNSLTNSANFVSGQQSAQSQIDNAGTFNTSNNFGNDIFGTVTETTALTNENQVVNSAEPVYNQAAFVGGEQNNSAITFENGSNNDTSNFQSNMNMQEPVQNSNEQSNLDFNINNTASVSKQPINEVSNINTANVLEASNNISEVNNLNIESNATVNDNNVSTPTFQNPEYQEQHLQSEPDNSTVNIDPTIQINNTANFQSVVDNNVGGSNVNLETTNQDNSLTTPVSDNTNLGINTNNVNNNLNEISQVNDEDLLKAYVGKKYDKIKNGKFNIWSFFFGSLYFMYRKMFLYGIIIYTIQLILLNGVKYGGWICVIIDIILGLFTNKIYLQEVSKRVSKIKADNSGKSYDVIATICELTGGTSKLLLSLGMYVISTITTIVLIVMMIMGIGNLFKSIGDTISGLINGKVNINVPNNADSNKDSNNDFSDNTSEEYNGILSFDTTIKINDIFSVIIPSDFKEDSMMSEDYSINYTYDGSAIFGDCSFSLSSPLGYKSAESLASSMHDYYSASTDASAMNSVTYNNIDWYGFSSANSLSTDYYYLTNKDGKIYLFNYESGRDNLETCNIYKDMIFNSIKLK